MSELGGDVRRRRLGVALLIAGLAVLWWAWGGEGAGDGTSAERSTPHGLVRSAPPEDAVEARASLSDHSRLVLPFYGKSPSDLVFLDADGRIVDRQEVGHEARVFYIDGAWYVVTHRAIRAHRWDIRAGEVTSTTEYDPGNHQAGQAGTNVSEFVAHHQGAGEIYFQGTEMISPGHHVHFIARYDVEQDQFLDSRWDLGYCGVADMVPLERESLLGVRCSGRIYLFDVSEPPAPDRRRILEVKLPRRVREVEYVRKADGAPEQRLTDASDNWFESGGSWAGITYARSDGLVYTMSSNGLIIGVDPETGFVVKRLAVEVPAGMRVGVDMFEADPDRDVLWIGLIRRNAVPYQASTLMALDLASETITYETTDHAFRLLEQDEVNGGVFLVDMRPEVNRVRKLRVDARGRVSAAYEVRFRADG